MRDYAAGSDHCASANRHSLQNGSIHSDPNVIFNYDRGAATGLSGCPAERANIVPICVGYCDVDATHNPIAERYGPGCSDNGTAKGRLKINFTDLAQWCSSIS